MPDHAPFISMLHEEGSFEASDGVRLYERRWLPGGARRGLVVLVHGLSDHSGRYEEVARRFTGLGLAVHAFDLVGHGRSPGARAYVRRFDRYVEDLARFVERLAPRPGEPVYGFGQSMGGTVLARYALARPGRLAGLLLASPALRIGGDVPPLLQRISSAVGLLLPRLPTVRLDADAVSRDPAVVAAYRSDPLVYRGRIPARTGAELVRTIRLLERDAERLTLPLLLLHGTADRLTDPAGTRALHARAASSDKTLRLYEGLYHETFREPERERVLADLAGWLEPRMG